jgi:chromosome partitioning protein
LTRYNSRTTISKDLAAALSQTAAKLDTRVYNTKIRECTAIKEAQALRRDIFSYAPNSNAAADYSSLIDEIIGG